jgi:hypothetical protein
MCYFDISNMSCYVISRYKRDTTDAGDNLSPCPFLYGDIREMRPLEFVAFCPSQLWKRKHWPTDVSPTNSSTIISNLPPALHTNSSPVPETHGGTEVYLHEFLTSTMDGDGQDHTPTVLPLGTYVPQPARDRWPGSSLLSYNGSHIYSA